MGRPAAARLVEECALPLVLVPPPSAGDLTAALAECESRGVCGGAVHDRLHSVVPRKARAQVFYTLNLRDFQSLARPCDLRIEMS